MPPVFSSVAILFFSRSADKEGDCKQLFTAGSDRENTSVVNYLIAHTYRQLRKTKLPIIAIDEDRQHGTTFGERFTDAFQQAFARGHDYVIAVGNDTPELTAEHTKEAAHMLQSGRADVVLGPAGDGGTWLMGYSRQAFDPYLFQQLPWNTSRLFEVVQKHITTSGKLYLLEQLDDIDDDLSLKKFLNKDFANALLEKLITYIRSAIATGKNIPAYRFYDLYSSFIKSKPPLRAPPLMV